MVSMKKIIKLIGFPLGHSVSPAMQNAAFKELGLAYQYELEEVAPDKLEETIERLKNDPNIAGFNVTVPYKERVLPLLDELDAQAKAIGAVNTVVKKNNKLIGSNTDGTGFIFSLKFDAKFDPKDKKAVVLGAGGASRAVCVMLQLNGAQKITISDIVEEKALEIAKLINGSSVKANSTQLQTAINEADILVNTSPVGMQPKIDQMPVPDNFEISANVLVYDLVYNPAKTKLMQKAKKSCSGLGMLVRQGALAFKKWTGKDAPLDVMRKAAQQALSL